MEKKRCLITGKMLTVTSSLDRINGLLSKVTPSELATLAQDMADMRAEWAKDQALRTSAKGHTMMRKYRRLASVFKEVTGTEPPSIYADI